MAPPLDGITVLDLTRLVPGAYCSMVLANFGAEVIKVEQPGSGDPLRIAPPLVDGVGVRFQMVNRGKLSVALDLKHPLGCGAFLRLAERADVLIEGFRPGVMQRLGLGYESLQRSNPRLVYCAITGYGQYGPLARSPGHDLNFMAQTGGLEMNGSPGAGPALPFTQVADLAGGGLMALAAILLALRARDATGRGQFIDVSMFDGLLALQLEAVAYVLAGEAPTRGHTRLTGQLACYATYETKDGRYIAVAAMESKFWANLCRRLGTEELIPLQFAEGEAQTQVRRRLAECFRSRPLAEWMETLAGADTCCTPVLTTGEALAQEHVRARGLWPVESSGTTTLAFPPTLRLSGSPAAPPLSAPSLGEHTDDILRRVGFSEGELSRMREHGAVA